MKVAAVRGELTRANLSSSFEDVRDVVVGEVSCQSYRKTDAYCELLDGNPQEVARRFRLYAEKFPNAAIEQTIPLSVPGEGPIA